MGMNTGGGGYGVGTPAGYSSGYGVQALNLTIGTKAQSDLSYKYGTGVNAANPVRTFPRGGN
jgi:hypothetical protein